MSATKIRNPRVLRTGSPLALDAIRTVAPAVFAEQAHASRSDRYLYVPTIRPLEMLLDNGWGVYEASQQRSRSADRDPYTKHMLRLRKLSDFNVSALQGEGVPEVVLINAHDGTAAYHGYAGFFRFICSNGMMVGRMLSGFKVQHTVGPRTSTAVLEQMESTVTDQFPIMLEQIDAMRDYRIELPQAMQIANEAMRLRYGDTLPPFNAEELLRANRPADEGWDLWRVLNRVQENIMNGGWETRSLLFNRRSMVRPVERVSAVTKINVGLWTTAYNMVLEG